MKYILFFIATSYSILNFAQQQNYYNESSEYLKSNSIWSFTRNSGIDFNKINPEGIKLVNTVAGAYGSAAEGFASVCDPITGELLFYSNGMRCWNKNQQIMPNGDSLFGNRGSVTQGVCIVPFIDSPNKYYIFSMTSAFDNMSPPNGPGTLFYSVIDMNLDNGLGDIIQGQKNIKLFDDVVSEGMIAIPGNNCDIWLMLHDYQKPVFRAYRIKNDGIDTTPILSITGQEIQGGVAYSVGKISVSPDRNKIAITSSGLGTQEGVTGTILAKFDANTGQVSDGLYIDEFAGRGIAFSPDNSKLYVSVFEPYVARIWQCEVNTHDSLSIVTSKIDINVDSNVRTADLKLFDNKIYVAHGSYSSFLGCINQPNLSGLSCSYDTTVISLFPGTGPNYSSTLSNDVVYSIPPDTIRQKVVDTIICHNESVTFNADTSFTVYLWDDGSKGSSRTITGAGKYYVLTKDECHWGVDTFLVEVFDFTPPVINVDELVLSTTTTYSKYQWMLNGNIISGATQPTYTVTENGEYQVIVVSNKGCTDTSAIYNVTNVPTSVFNSDFNKNINIYPNPSKGVIYIDAPIDVNVILSSIDGRRLSEYKKTKQIAIGDFTAGVYLLSIYDLNNNLIKVEKVIKPIN